MGRRFALVTAAVAMLGLLAACEQVVAPQATNPAIDQWLDNHVVETNPTVTQSGKLFVFLPGTSLHPAQSRDLLKEVASHGTPAIGLQDPNTFNVYDLCQGNTTCEEKVRLEVIDGVDRTPLVTISPANSIIGRLVSLLQYLDRTSPNAFGSFGWSAFLDGGAPRWSSIVIAGHSQGASNSALIARDHSVARVVMLGGPSDFDPNGNLAGWVTGAHVTASSRYYGFSHTGDSLVSIHEASWTALGMTGPVHTVDGQSAPYGGSHELTTSAATSDPHDSVALDSVTPVDSSGAAVFAPVWRYLCCS